MSSKGKGYLLGFFSAFFYALNVPLAKRLISKFSSNTLLFILYFGAAIGLFVILLFRNKKFSLKPGKGEVPWITGVIACDIIAALLVVESLKYLNASTVSLLSVLEGAFTIVVVCMLFRAKMNSRLFLSVLFTLVGGIALSFDENSVFDFSVYSLLVVGATLMWGLENNFTAKASDKDPFLVVFYKCLFVALFNLMFVLNSNVIHLLWSNWYLLVAGFFTYGLGILLFACSTKYIGAGRASIIFSLSPVVGAFFSLILFKEAIGVSFFVSLGLMLLGIYFSFRDDSAEK
ncbi:MAG: DMT family transporter [bacterium]|nr:DMT family transporter [bacterium]